MNNNELQLTNLEYKVLEVFCYSYCEYKMSYDPPLLFFSMKSENLETLENLQAKGNFRKKDGKWEVEDYFYGWCLRIEEGPLDSTVYIGNIDKINPENCAKFINSYKMKNRIEEIKSLKQKIKNIQDLIMVKEENIALAIVEDNLERTVDKDSEELQQ